MAFTVTHKFHSGKADSTDLTLINPSNWNDTHSVVDTSKSAVNVDYIFTPQAPGGNLTAGITNSITLTPVPQGINGTDTKHYLYISGGTGTAEAVLITGGTAVAGAVSGTILFVPANNHSGGWIIQSANGGIAEAQQYLITNFGAGRVTIAPGNFTIYGSIGYQPNMQFAGSGAGSILTLSATSLNVFVGNVPVKTNSEFTLVADNVLFRDFTIDAIGLGTGVNSCGGITGFNSITSVEIWSYINITVNNVDFNNVFNAVYFHRGFGISVLNCRLWNNSAILFSDSSVANIVNFFSAALLVDNLTYYWHPMAGTGIQTVMTTAVVTFNNCESAKVANSYFSLRGATSNTGQAYGIVFAGGEDGYVMGCTFLNPWTAVLLASISNGATIYYASFVRIINCSIDQLWGPAIFFTNGTGVGLNQANAHIQIVNNQITDMVQSQGTKPYFINTGAWARQITITDNIFRNMYGSQGQFGVVIGANTNCVIVANNLFDNETGDISGCVALFVDHDVIQVSGLETNQFQPGKFGTNILTFNSNVASAAALNLIGNFKFYTITGTTNITSINYNGIYGQTFTLVFNGALTVVDAGNILIAGNFVSSGTAPCMLTLFWDGNNAIEISRAIN